MPHYVITGRYSASAMRGFLINPEDRSESVAKLIEASGGRMLHYLVTFGETDFLILCEGPDNEAVLSALIVAGGTGGVTDITTRVAMTTAEAKAAMARAGEIAAGFRPAGG